MSTDKIITAANYLPNVKTIASLKKAAKSCEGCHLYKTAIQTVFGDGSSKARLMIVGEIAGEKEDEVGKPFVGPAGKLLHKSVDEAGLDLTEIYFTNVVKHFKYSYMNKRKLHRSPDRKEIKACLPWLEAEITVIQPQVILCLGAVAAKTLVSKDFLIHEQRGHWHQFNSTIKILVTFHPSAILRAPERKLRHEMNAYFLKDIKKVATFLADVKNQRGY